MELEGSWNIAWLFLSLSSHKKKQKLDAVIRQPHDFATLVLILMI
jgi:hypothetical protein